MTDEYWVGRRKRRFSPVGFAPIAGVFVLLAASPAQADPWCGAGRHVGSENEGAGNSWLCLPDAPRSAPSGGGSFSGGSGAPAALGMGAAALDLFSALDGILDRPPAGPTQEELDQQARERQMEEEDAAAAARAKAEGAALAAEARRDAEAGQYAAARDAFRRALERSGDYAYQQDMTAMDSLLHLQQAITMSGKGQTASGYTEFVKAEALAKQAFRPDIAQQIEKYRVALFAVINNGLARDAKGARDAAKQLSTNCIPVNGDFVCD